MFLPIFLLVILKYYTFALQCVSVEPSVHTYNWTVYYTKGNLDGFFRKMIVIDDSNDHNDVLHYPGPTIDVMKDDTIDLYLYNSLSTESISIHWHGIHQQKSPWMDGVQ